MYTFTSHAKAVKARDEAVAAGLIPAPVEKAVPAPTTERMDATEFAEAILGRYSSISTPGEIDAAYCVWQRDHLLGATVEVAIDWKESMEAKLAARKAEIVSTTPSDKPVGMAEYLAILAADERLAPAPIAETPTITVPCCDAESIPCGGCADEVLLSVVELDPLVGLPWDRPARIASKPVEPSFKPRRPIAPPPGRYTLDELAEAQAAFYRSEGNPVADLFAKVMADLAKSIRSTGATSVAQYEDRAEALDAMRADELRASYYDRGHEDALESVGAAR